jgi:putative RNA 2'-phosphotransferase
MNHTAASKFLSLVLRHQPELIGLTLDENGWVSVEELLKQIQTKGYHLSSRQLKELVDTNDKKRFVFSEDGQWIRAAQGHSITVDLQLTPATPPTQLFHGTAERNVTIIQKEGLKKGKRHHVHLSADVETARAVGTRYGKPVVFVVDAAAMQQEGFVFYLSENGVWLTDAVPARYLALG